MERAPVNDSVPGLEGELVARRTLGVLRRILLGLLVLGMLGTAVELVFLGHFEDGWQLAPLGVIASGFVVLVWHSIDRSANSILVLRLVMALAIASAGVGFVLHYQSNAEFQLDIDPSLSGPALWLKVIQAKAPPALAPGIMAQLGLLGLAYTYRHPALDIDLSK
jgi:hypothetical protein